MEIVKGFYQLHVDGGRKHSKDGQKASAAIAFVLCDPKGQDLPDGRRSQPLHPTPPDSTSAEYEAILAGLDEARRRSIPYVAVFTDSRNVVNQISGRFRSSGHLDDYRVRLQGVLEEFPDWQLSWIPREWNKAHSGIRDSL